MSWRFAAGTLRSPLGRGRRVWGTVTKPTVGHCISFYLPRSETFVYTQLRFQQRFRPIVLATHMTENLSEFPFDPVVELLPGGHGKRRLRRALRALVAGERHGHVYAYRRRLTTEANRCGCVLLHAHFGWMGIAALPARERLGLPLVTTFYGQDLLTPPDGYDRLFAEGEAFLCEGPFMARRLAALGCPDERIRIVPIGIDLEKFPFAPARPISPLVVLQACRFVEKKGVDLAIRAYAAVAPRLGRSELWLVGDGPERSRLQSLARELHVAGAVRFLGMLSHEGYRSVLERAHIGIQPSRTASDGDTEGGAPTTILEMQAVGVPVVATSHADIPSVVPEATRLVDENDVEGLAQALLELAEADAGERHELALRGRMLVESRHDARTVAEAIASVYEEVLNGKLNEDAPPQRTVVSA